MKLIDLQEKIIRQLCKMTIDDFYSDPQIGFIKKIFSEENKLYSDEDIEQFLVGKFPETVHETIRYSLEQSINQFNEKVEELQLQIKSSESNIQDLESKVEKAKEHQSNNKKLQNKSNLELKDIENEITQLQPLAGKAPYDKQLDALEKSKEQINNDLGNCAIAISKTKEELNELQIKIEIEKEIISTKQSEIEKNLSKIGDVQKELTLHTEKENTHYKNEYAALEFLFKTLLHKKISKQEIVTHKITGKKYSIKSFFPNKNDIIKTGEQHLLIYDCSIEEVCELLLPITINKSVIPKDWRKIIYKTLSNPIVEIAGTVSKILPDSTSFFKKEKLEIKNIDYSTLLATKISVTSKHSFRAYDNKIFLALSGGLSATISFREKGDLISKFQTGTTEIYANCLYSKQYIFQELYLQKGYADSKIGYYTPGSYYILSDKFVIEIKYAPAPVFFDNSQIVQFAPNISSKAKIEDEIQEEEFKRKEEEDQANWDDYWDD